MVIRKSRIYLTGLLIVLGSLFAYADFGLTPQPQTYTMMLSKRNKDPEPGNYTPDPERRRTGTRLIECTIHDMTGIESEIPKYKIICYEIWDNAGHCIGIYHDDVYCAQLLFKFYGEYQLCIQTEEYTYSGWIYIE